MLPKPILKNDMLTLRPITEHDAPAMHASLTDAEGMRLTGTHNTYTLEQVTNFCKRISQADDRADYAILLNTNPDTPIGEIVLNDIDTHNQSASYRVALYSTRHYNKGIGTQATRLILEYAFMTLNLHRVELEVFAFNPRALRMYEKCGFIREGIKRDALLWDGEFVDAIVMGILKPDYLKFRSD